MAIFSGFFQYCQIMVIFSMVLPFVTTWDIIINSYKKDIVFVVIYLMSWNINFS